MSKYERVKAYYDNGYWDINRVRKAVVHGWITTDEYKDITGEDY